MDFSFHQDQSGFLIPSVPKWISHSISRSHLWSSTNLSFPMQQVIICRQCYMYISCSTSVFPLERANQPSYVHSHDLDMRATVAQVGVITLYVSCSSQKYLDRLSEQWWLACWTDLQSVISELQWPPPLLCSCLMPGLMSCMSLSVMSCLNMLYKDVSLSDWCPIMISTSFVSWCRLS